MDLGPYHAGLDPYHDLDIPRNHVCMSPYHVATIPTPSQDDSPHLCSGSGDSSAASVYVPGTALAILFLVLGHTSVSAWTQPNNQVDTDIHVFFFLFILLLNFSFFPFNSIFVDVYFS